MVIEAYTYMAKMIQPPKISNTDTPTQIINSKPMMFSRPVYHQQSPTTMLIEEEDASPERVAFSQIEVRVSKFLFNWLHSLSNSLFQ